MTYDDTYATCERTYATLCIYEVSAEEVSMALTLEPTEIQRAGATRSVRGTDCPDGWFLSTSATIDSKDVRRHLDCLLDLLLPHSAALAELRQQGAKMEISCYWLSVSGHGGPTVSPQQAGKLAALDLDCWFDVYLLGD